MSFLEVRALTVAYSGLVAVRELSVSLERDQVLGVIGPNGAGKSSLLRCIAGLVRPAGGTVALEGKDLARSSVEARARLGVALSPEGRGVFAPLTVEENLRLGAYSSGRLPRQALDERLGSVFELFPVLGERRGQRAATLSGGEAAMLSVGRALMSSPRLLLLDEPTLGLAPRVSEALFERLRALKRARQSMVVVEQRAAGLLSVADHVLAMRQGEARATLPAAGVRTDRLDELYFGRRGP